MKWEDVIIKTGSLPLIDSNILLPFFSSKQTMEVQLSRWTSAGKLVKLRRGLYLLAPPYRKTELFEPHIASRIAWPSYISFEKALEHHNLIPEVVPVFTCVTPKRGGRFVTPAGTYDYKHIDSSHFWGYNSVTVNGQTAFFASPEKALLDIFYMRKIKVTVEYLDELRLQNTDAIDTKTLDAYAERFGRPSLVRAAQTLRKYLPLSGKEKNL